MINYFFSCSPRYPYRQQTSKGRVQELPLSNSEYLFHFKHLRWRCDWNTHISPELCRIKVIHT